MPQLGDQIEVEVECEGELQWRKAQVRKLLASHRFVACVAFASGEWDELFVEEYGMEEEGAEWRWATVESQKGTAEASPSEKRAKRGRNLDDRGRRLLEPEDRVEARYDGGMYFYPGKVTRRNPDGTLDILYDDGEQETVARSLVRLEKACARPLKTAVDATDLGDAMDPTPTQLEVAVTEQKHRETAEKMTVRQLISEAIRAGRSSRNAIFKYVHWQRRRLKACRAARGIVLRELRADPSEEEAASGGGEFDRWRKVGEDMYEISEGDTNTDAEQQPSYSYATYNPARAEWKLGEAAEASVTEAEGYSLVRSRGVRSGYMGVRLHSSSDVLPASRFVAYYKDSYLGSFDTAVAAAVAYARKLESLQDTDAQEDEGGVEEEGEGEAGDTAQLPTQPEPLPAGLPEGWTCIEHHSASGRLYKRYKGPNDERAQSRAMAWDVHLRPPTEEESKVEAEDQAVHEEETPKKRKRMSKAEVPNAAEESEEEIVDGQEEEGIEVVVRLGLRVGEDGDVCCEIRTEEAEKLSLTEVIREAIASGEELRGGATMDEIVQHVSDLRKRMTTKFRRDRIVCRVKARLNNFWAEAEGRFVLTTKSKELLETGPPVKGTDPLPKALKAPDPVASEEEVAAAQAETQMSTLRGLIQEALAIGKESVGEIITFVQLRSHRSLSVGQTKRFRIVDRLRRGMNRWWRPKADSPDRFELLQEGEHDDNEEMMVEAVEVDNTDTEAFVVEVETTESLHKRKSRRTKKQVWRDGGEVEAEVLDNVEDSEVEMADVVTAVVVEEDNDTNGRSSNKSELPPGWSYLRMRSKSGVNYTRYLGPDKTRAQSVPDAWRKYEKQQQSQKDDEDEEDVPVLPAEALAEPAGGNRKRLRTSGGGMGATAKRATTTTAAASGSNALEKAAWRAEKRSAAAEEVEQEEASHPAAELQPEFQWPAGRPATGEHVEIVMIEHGMQGSRYPATVMSCAEGGARFLVEFHTLFDASDEADKAGTRLAEWQPIERLVPPPEKEREEAPEPKLARRSASASLRVPQWLATLPIGGELQMQHEGGWWPVKLLERRAANLRLNEPATYRVAAIGYQVQQWASCSQLRRRAVRCTQLV